MNRTTRGAAYTCPGCGARNDAHTHVGGSATPKKGDVSICLYCGMVLLWDGLGMREPTEAEWKDLEANPDFQRGRAVVAAAQLHRRRN